MKVAPLLLLLTSGVQSFGNYELSLTVVENEGWCVSPLDEEMYAHDCDDNSTNATDCSAFDQYTCWEACEQSGLTFTNVDFWEADASCYCQNDCLCMADVDDDDVRLASDGPISIPQSCCGAPELSFDFYNCTGTTLTWHEYCMNGQLDTCAWFTTADTVDDYCYEDDDGIYACVCDADLSLSCGYATDCEGTNITVEETYAGWVDWTQLGGCDSDDDGGRRLSLRNEAPPSHARFQKFAGKKEKKRYLKKAKHLSS